jgi:protoporphyrinogen oxidase
LAKHVGIIGGGVAGMVAAWHLARAGRRVTLFERAPRLGGLAGSFEVEPGKFIEKYYHFICRGDSGYLGQIDHFGLRSRLHWVETEMGVFHHGEARSMGDPISLLTLPWLSAADRLRFGVVTLASKLRGKDSWRDLENVTARDWLRSAYGPRTYEFLYEPLLRLKFGEHADQISAAWMWARVHRVGNSRTRLQREYVGYLEGGSQTYIDALEKGIRELGVELRTGASVDEVVVEGGRVTALRAGGERIAVDQALSTVPIPYTRTLFGSFEGAYFDNLRALKYIGVVVMTLRVRRRLTRYFWLNVNDRSYEVAGVIEYTNLNPTPELGGDSIVYIPQYVPAADPLFKTSQEEIFAFHFAGLQRIVPGLNRSDIVANWVHKDAFAQPICEVGFAAKSPAIHTPVPNLFLTDSYQLHPHDRAISFSIDLATEAARRMRSTESGL